MQNLSVMHICLDYKAANVANLSDLESCQLSNSAWQLFLLSNAPSGNFINLNFKQKNQQHSSFIFTCL